MMMHDDASDDVGGKKSIFRPANIAEIVKETLHPEAWDSLGAWV